MVAATNGPLVQEMGSLLSQFGVNAQDIMGMLRTGADFIGSFRVNVLQYMAQQRMPTSRLNSILFGYFRLNWVQRSGKFLLIWVFEEPRQDSSWFYEVVISRG
jgi:hypothetical protein